MPQNKNVGKRETLWVALGVIIVWVLILIVDYAQGGKLSMIVNTLFERN